MSTTLTPKMFTTEQAAARLGLSPQTLTNWRTTGRAGPPFVRVGAKAIRYDPQDLDSYIESQRVNPST